jgi:hypothetical protein
VSVTRPTTDPLWDTNDTNTADPGAALRLDGYAFRDELPSDEHNYLHKTAGDWIDFLRRNSTFSTLPEGIGATEAGDVFRVSGDFPAGAGVVEAEIPNTAGSAVEYIDTDGDYFIWCTSEDRNLIRLRRFDDASEVLIAIPAAELADSIAMDGLYIWVHTTAGNLHICDYAGTFLAVVAQAGYILDVERGHCLLWENATTWRLRDTALASVGSAVVAGASPLEVGRIAQTGPICDVLVGYTSGIGAQHLELYSEAGVLIWAFPTTTMATACWYLAIDGPLAQLVVQDAGNDYLVTVPIGDQVPTAARILMLSTNHHYYCATPHFLTAIEHLSTTVTYIGWDGTDLGTITTYEGQIVQDSCVCDGTDLIYTQFDAIGVLNRVIRHPLGNLGMSFRRYDWDDWRPFCHSLGVACERVYIGAGLVGP